ncbi:Serine carboxypeptidase [Rhizoctonia solani]|uniref:Serine carboxypeptidase n=1 Tax=Rhizoctonia solani TaxID=456999 RepID=A0A8H8SVC3_9AGAM|nr:Serine carboxypeptidase [Rhizoctonia solani]QRW18297.1 Serine carboxypeptidase [Rhizoctonia solani]
MATLSRYISSTGGTLKPATAAQSSTAEQRFQPPLSFSRDIPVGSELSRGPNVAAALKGTRSVGLPHVASSERKVSVGWSNTVTSHFHHIWLRDHCRCADCLHPVTKQRLVNTFEIPPDVQPTRVESRPSGLEVTWTESPRHVSTYPWEWLSRSSYDPPMRHSFALHNGSKTLWGSTIQQSPPTVSYEEVMRNDAGVYKWLQKIDEFGFCFVSGVPPNPKDTESLTRRIAFIHGGFWDFTSDLKHGDTAYTNLALGAHTDTTYLSDPCGLQLFHLLSHEGLGGQTLLVDGFYAAAKLREKYPSHYELLTEVKISAHAAGDADSLYIPDEPFSILKKGINGELTGIRYNNDDRSALKYIDPVLVDDWYDALRSWNRCLTSSDAEFWVQLTAGTAVVVDNHRVLHGRSAFTENFLPKVDGVTRCLAQLLNHLKNEGHEVIILGPEVNMLTYETYPIIGTVGIPLMLYPDLKLNFLRPKFLQSIQEFDPDVIHVVDPIWLGPQVLHALQSGWCGPRWASPNAPIVASFHTNLPTKVCLAVWAKVHGAYNVEVDSVYPFSMSVNRLPDVLDSGDADAQSAHKRCPALRGEWGIKNSPGRSDPWTNKNVYPLTPPPSPIPSENNGHAYRSEQCVILYAGRLSYEKNLHFLIESYGHLLDMLGGSTALPLFIFVGEGPARASLEDLCRCKGIPARFTGHLSGEQLTKCYASADIFAFPSYTETFGQVILEALASGLPVVGLDADGTRDLVQHERTGLLLQHRANRLDSSLTNWSDQFYPGTKKFQVLSRQYAALLHRLVCNATLRSVMGGCASASTPVGRSWSAAMECMVECYREAIVSSDPEDIDYYKGLALTAVAQHGEQSPLRLNPNFARPGLQSNLTAYGSNVQHLELSSLSAEDFSVLGHQAFPSHQVRVKRVKDFCDPTVRMYSGYLDVDYGAKHLFFYFFESRNDPDSDPVLMWINGGPGCSSSLGLFMELGPCSIRGPLQSGSNGTDWNPYSWNNKANLFFLDQKYSLGVGFSYADYGETVSTTEDAAKNVQAFVTIFFETFSKFKGREFHMSGESYGGRYLPVFASEIVDQNSRAEAGGFEPINLKSVLIGNGLTDFKTMWEGYYDIQCKNLSVVPFQDIKTCVTMKQQLHRCLKMYQKDCVEQTDPVACSLAAGFCNEALSLPYQATGRNPYDMTKPEELQSSLCYPITEHINTFLDRPETRKALGVHPSIGNYTGCSRDVGVRFSASLDHFHSNQWYVAGLLERGIKVLVYVGTYDWICNWVGNQKWVMALDWTGSAEFTAQKDRNWIVDSQVAGFTRSANGLTFATVDAAGHMVPYDKPKEALAMLSRWLEGKDL